MAMSLLKLCEAYHQGQPLGRRAEAVVTVRRSPCRHSPKPLDGKRRPTSSGGF
jgi:hypothetical protein